MSTRSYIGDNRVVITTFFMSKTTNLFDEEMAAPRAPEAVAEQERRPEGDDGGGVGAS